MNIIYAGAGVTSALLLTRSTTVDPFQKHMSTNKPMGKYSEYGDYLGQLIPNILYMSGMYIDFRVSGNSASLTNGTIMLKASAYAGLTTMVLKSLIGERRPNGGDSRSFPSGHTTTAFAFASVVAANHAWYWGVFSYSLATMVGLSRINDNAHYLHDVAFGATIGAAFGYAFSWDKDKGESGQSNFTPIILKDRAEVRYTARF